MYKLFDYESPVATGAVTVSGWKYVRDGLRQNLGTVLSYYRKNPTAVKSQHFLVRLIESFAVPRSLELDRYYDNVADRALNISMALKMTSSIFKGSLFNGVFYGGDNKEILVAHTDWFDFWECNRNWENVCPVRVLSHSFTDLGLNIPDGRVTSIESGLNVIAINIPMLMIQYRAFRRNEWEERGQYGENERSVMQFVRMYVLPNMLFSHLDVALFNRIAQTAKGAPLGLSTAKHSFHLIDYADKIDTVNSKILKDLSNNLRDFVTIMRTVPMVTKDNMEQLMYLPKMASTRQVDWALAICRLSALSFLFRVSKGGPGTRNRSEVNQVLKYMLAYKTENLFEEMLPIEQYLRVKDQLTQLAEQSK